MTLDPNLVHSGRSEHGHSCRDNPECSEVKDYGPTPPGTYNMRRVDNYGGSYWLDEGRLRRFFNDRSEFFLHEGSVSHGCITVKRGSPAWNDLMRLLDGDSNNTMTVRP